MKCTNCGHELSDQARFCNNCGKPVDSGTADYHQNEPIPDHGYAPPAENGDHIFHGYGSPAGGYDRAGRPPKRKPPRNNKKKALIISAVALVLVIAILAGVIVIVANRNTASAKELKEAKESYLPPAQAVKIDASLDDPSNDDIQFKYDDRARIISCTYTANEKTYDQSYTYDDEQRRIDIETYYKDQSICSKDIDYDRVEEPDTFEDIDGYYIRLDDQCIGDEPNASSSKAAETAEPETKEPLTDPPTEPPTDPPADWKELYIDFLNTTDVWGEYIESQSGNLFYVDDNDIPELVILTTGGNHQQTYEFCWIENGSVQHESFGAGGMNYQERGGEVFSAVGGNYSGCWTLYTFDGASFYKSHYGSRYAKDIKNPVFKYEVDDEFVSEEEYNSSYKEYEEWDRMNDLKTWTKRSSLPDYIRNYEE